MSAASSAAVPPSAKVSVAMSLCGAPANVPGENTSTKLMPRFSQSTARRLAMRAVMLRPSTLTVIGVADLEVEIRARVLFSSETSGGPA